MQIAILLYPSFFTLDVINPQTFFERFGAANVFYVARTREPVVSELGLSFAPAHDFESCPKDLDILFVPGGLKGSIPAMNDRATIDFLADRGARATYVTSVCTGSLLLGAARACSPGTRLRAIGWCATCCRFLARSSSRSAS